MIKIPETIIRQENFNHFNGDISQSFGIELTEHYGAIRANAPQIGALPDDMTDLASALFFNGAYYLMSANYFYKGGDAPQDSFTKDVTSNAPSSVDAEYTNAKEFNGSIYVPNGTGIKKLNGTTWSNAISSGLTVQTTHLQEVFGNRLYITNNDNVFSVSTSDVLSTSGTATADFGLSGGYAPTMLEACGDSLFVGYLNVDDGSGIVFEWDGQTENTPTTRIDIEAGIVAGKRVGNTIFSVHSDGSLRYFTGAQFKIIDRFFTKSKNTFRHKTLTSVFERFVHPNGMVATDYGSVLILFNNVLEGGTYEVDTPPGVYEYTPDTGLYLKHTIGGCSRVVSVGALHYKPAIPGQNGTVLFGAKYLTNASSEEWGLFFDNSQKTDKTNAFFVTRKILSSNIIDRWAELYVFFKKLAQSNDKIVVKYRTEDISPIEITGTWTSTTTFTTTSNGCSVGDEVFIVSGTGAGMCAHITQISHSMGTYTITIDEVNTVASGTSLLHVSPWVKIEKITPSYERDGVVKLTPGVSSPWIQFKLCISFDGQGEIYFLKLDNKQEI